VAAVGPDDPVQGGGVDALDARPAGAGGGVDGAAGDPGRVGVGQGDDLGVLGFAAGVAGVAVEAVLGAGALEAGGDEALVVGDDDGACGAEAAVGALGDGFGDLQVVLVPCRQSLHCCPPKCCRGPGGLSSGPLQL